MFTTATNCWTEATSGAGIDIANYAFPVAPNDRWLFQLVDTATAVAAGDPAALASVQIPNENATTPSPLAQAQLAAYGVAANRIMSTLPYCIAPATGPCPATSIDISWAADSADYCLTQRATTSSTPQILGCGSAGAVSPADLAPGSYVFELYPASGDTLSSDTPVDSYAFEAVQQLLGANTFTDLIDDYIGGKCISLTGGAYTGCLAAWQYMSKQKVLDARRLGLPFLRGSLFSDYQPTFSWTMAHYATYEQRFLEILEFAAANEVKIVLNFMPKAVTLIPEYVEALAGGTMVTITDTNGAAYSFTPDGVTSATEGIHDMLVHPASLSYQLNMKIITDFTKLILDDPSARGAILLYEMSNELSSVADFDATASTVPTRGTPPSAADCFNTAELISFSKTFVDTLVALGVQSRMISPGYAHPNPASYHLEIQATQGNYQQPATTVGSPSCVNSPKKTPNSNQLDTEDQAIEHYLRLQQYFDVQSIHLYTNDASYRFSEDASSSFLSVVAMATALEGKMFYLGEFGRYVDPASPQAAVTDYQNLLETTDFSYTSPTSCAGLTAAYNCNDEQEFAAELATLASSAIPVASYWGIELHYSTTYRNPYTGGADNTPDGDQWMSVEPGKPGVYTTLLDELVALDYAQVGDSAVDGGSDTVPRCAIVWPYDQMVGWHNNPMVTVQTSQIVNTPGKAPAVEPLTVAIRVNGTSIGTVAPADLQAQAGAGNGYLGYQLALPMQTYTTGEQLTVTVTVADDTGKTCTPQSVEATY